MSSSQRVTFAIQGLGCASCSIDVGRALRRIPGVVDVNINYMANQGFAEFDSNQVGWDSLAASLTDRGYTVVKRR